MIDSSRYGYCCHRTNLRGSWWRPPKSPANDQWKAYPLFPALLAFWANGTLAPVCTKQILWGFYLSRRQTQQRSALLQKTGKALPKMMSLNFPDDLTGLRGVPAEANELFSPMSIRTKWCTTTRLHSCISVGTNDPSLWSVTDAMQKTMIRHRVWSDQRMNRRL